MFSARTASAAVIFLVILSGFSLFCPDDSSAVSVESGEYGAVASVDFSEFDQACQQLTGKKFSEWIADISASLTDYNIDSNDLGCRIAAKAKSL